MKLETLPVNAPLPEGFVSWPGPVRPPPVGTVLDLVFRNRALLQGAVHDGRLRWGQSGKAGDIIGFRVGGLAQGVKDRKDTGRREVWRNGEFVGTGGWRDLKLRPFGYYADLPGAGHRQLALDLGEIRRA